MNEIRRPLQTYNFILSVMLMIKGLPFTVIVEVRLGCFFVECILYKLNIFIYIYIHVHIFYNNNANKNR